MLDLPTGAYVRYMPGYLANETGGVLSTKIIALSPGNRDRGPPRTQATCLLHDPVTGVLLALLEAGYLTEIRTAAASALATSYPALPDAAKRCWSSARGHRPGPTWKCCRPCALSATPG